MTSSTSANCLKRKLDDDKIISHKFPDDITELNQYHKALNNISDYALLPKDLQTEICEYSISISSRWNEYQYHQALKHISDYALLHKDLQREICEYSIGQLVYCSGCNENFNIFSWKDNWNCVRCEKIFCTKCNYQCGTCRQYYCNDCQIIWECDDCEGICCDVCIYEIHEEEYCRNCENYLNPIY